MLCLAAYPNYRKRMTNSNHDRTVTLILKLHFEPQKCLQTHGGGHFVPISNYWSPQVWWHANFLSSQRGLNMYAYTLSRNVSQQGQILWFWLLCISQVLGVLQGSMTISAVYLTAHMQEIFHNTLSELIIVKICNPCKSRLFKTQTSQSIRYQGSEQKRPHSDFAPKKHLISHSYKK